MEDKCQDVSSVQMPSKRSRTRHHNSLLKQGVGAPERNGQDADDNDVDLRAVDGIGVGLDRAHFLDLGPRPIYKEQQAPAYKIGCRAWANDG